MLQLMGMMQLPLEFLFLYIIRVAIKSPTCSEILLYIVDQCPIHRDHNNILFSINLCMRLHCYELTVIALWNGFQFLLEVELLTVILPIMLINSLS